MNLEFKDLKLSMYDDAKAKEQTLTEYLNEVNGIDANSDIDGFELMLKDANIEVCGNGVAPNTNMDVFFASEQGRVLLPELTRRLFDKAMEKNKYYENFVANRVIANAPAVMASYVDFGDLSMKRVEELAEIPTIKFSRGDSAISLKKYGRAVEMSYEQLRYTNFDIFRTLIEAIVRATDNEKADEIVDILINGDNGFKNAGNKAEVVNAKSLDSKVTAGNVSEIALLKFLTSEKNIGIYDRILVGEKSLEALTNALYPMDAKGTSRILDKAFNSINLTMGLDKGNLTIQFCEGLDELIGDKDDKGIVAFKKDSAINEYVEKGSLINEMDRFIRNQSRVATVTENVGFAKFTKNASKILLFK